METKSGGFRAFLKRKNIEISPKRYGIDALGAMALGLFASLLIGTILNTIGTQAGSDVIVKIGEYAQKATGPAIAVPFRRAGWIRENDLKLDL